MNCHIITILVHRSIFGGGVSTFFFCVKNGFFLLSTQNLLLQQCEVYSMDLLPSPSLNKIFSKCDKWSCEQPLKISGDWSRHLGGDSEYTNTDRHANYEL